MSRNNLAHRQDAQDFFQDEQEIVSAGLKPVFYVQPGNPEKNPVHPVYS
ncbi:MAG TPA: hypothetical protein PKC13_32320 [Blastocatellia bacterium]|nr:hypothetical protein [Blastocatellia bacterium]HMX30312.1 hypothetical protein [Blastocatellia bacterium]HNG34303.1 hypothetical protein [Blastocatellia bacterium]